VRYAILPFDLSLQAISNGQLDAGSNFTDIHLTIWSGSLKDCRIVALIRSDASTRLLGIVARDGLPTTGRAWLKGRRIGYLRSSNYHYYLLQLLEEQGWRGAISCLSACRAIPCPQHSHPDNSTSGSPRASRRSSRSGAMAVA
jgi:hypothetical protein